MAPILVRASLVDVALEVDAQIGRRTRPEPARELALLVLLYVGYSAARLAARQASCFGCTADGRRSIAMPATRWRSGWRWASPGS